uniref:Putative secreted protein n=1 Tax=Anopheles darlingi TaxID=43151 RepID=A0A2M4DGJ7_ANODA
MLVVVVVVVAVFCLFLGPRRGTSGLFRNQYSTHFTQCSRRRFFLGDVSPQGSGTSSTAAALLLHSNFPQKRGE